MRKNQLIEPVQTERERLCFPQAVVETFGFLNELGFSRVEVLPTIVRYRKGDLEANVYQGRNSCELGLEIVREGRRYSLGEFIRAVDPEAAARYRPFAATTCSAVAKGVKQLAILARQYGQNALENDDICFRRLDSLAGLWREQYALEVLEGQLRPKADAAFRQGDYKKAAELYEPILTRLTPTELKKLVIAKKRAGQ